MAGQVAAVLVGATKEVQESSTQAMLVPLMFDQERLRLEVERLQRIQERGKQRISLLEHQRDRYIAEGTKLLDASNTLRSASNGITSVQTLLSGANKEAAFHAITVWVQSIAVDKLREEEIEVALISLDHDEALDASEFALNLWKHMVASPVEELTLLAYHVSGITFDDMSKDQRLRQVVNAKNNFYLGLVAIALFQQRATYEPLNEIEVALSGKYGVPFRVVVDLLDHAEG